jgi:Tfp pilus assembly protein PilN
MAVTQHLNLSDPRFTPRALLVSLRQTVLAAGLFFALLLLGATGLQLASARAVQEARRVDIELAPLRSTMLKNGLGHSEPDRELPDLKVLEASQRRIRAALEAGIAGTSEGHAGYLAALARQAPGGVWITGFSVSEDGSALELEGRMIDTAQFADYLRRLNAEPRFKGRPFGQLTLRVADAPRAAPGQPAITEFALRSASTAMAAASAVATGGKPATPAPGVRP